MSLGNARKRYIPMSETMFYILLSLKEERHGYGILQHVKMQTKGRIPSAQYCLFKPGKTRI